MNILYSNLPKQKYLAEMRASFTSPLAVFSWNSRLTGFVLGSFFAVAHYQPHEWNRQITNECNRAYGFVKEENGWLKIQFVRGKGMLSPCWLLFYTLLCRVMFAFFEIRNEMKLGSTAWILSFVCALVIGLATAFTDSITEEGQAGVWEIDKFLRNPETYFC